MAATQSKRHLFDRLLCICCPTERRCSLLLATARLVSAGAAQNLEDEALACQTSRLGLYVHELEEITRNFDRIRHLEP